MVLEAGVSNSGAVVGKVSIGLASILAIVIDVQVVIKTATSFLATPDKSLDSALFCYSCNMW